MIPDESPVPGLGHNRPGALVDALPADVDTALEKFAERKEQLIASASKIKVFDRISAGEAGDVLKIIREVYDLVDGEWQKLAKPYRDSLAAGRGKVQGFWDAVDTAKQALKQRLDAWTAEEDERIAAQQREQDEAMAKMRQARLPMHPMPHVAGEPQGTSAAVLPPRRRKIRGDLGATVSAVDVIEFEVEDVHKVPDWIMDTPTVHNAIISVAKSMRKHATEIPGLKRVTTTKNRIG